MAIELPYDLEWIEPPPRHPRRPALKWQRPQCNAKPLINPAIPEYYIPRRKTNAEKKGYDWEKCTRGATVKVNGICLCANHAGELMLYKGLGDPDPDWWSEANEDTQVEG